MSDRHRAKIQSVLSPAEVEQLEARLAQAEAELRDRDESLRLLLDYAADKPVLAGVVRGFFLAALSESEATPTPPRCGNCGAPTDEWQHEPETIGRCRLWKPEPAAAPTTDEPTCGLCGKPMPKGEEMFRYHGMSGPCPTTDEHGEDR